MRTQRQNFLDGANVLMEKLIATISPNNPLS
uniref:Uncharacterized protein n=1 Tax=Human betaherpesvirus 6 TaxID=10368 RepID=A0A5P9U5A8_9BETA|nr:hypothetical protein [Human betaherpesvirus 6]